MGVQSHALGDRVAKGNTSDVWMWSLTTVVKVLQAGIPRHWATLEADITSSVHTAGLPAPAIEDMVEVDGRPGIVFERIEGSSMWDRMKASPSELPRLAGDLVELQASVHEASRIMGLPDLASRLRDKIAAAKRLTPQERQRALEALTSLPGGTALCHGDMHPANVLMSPRGLVIVDWFDAACGQPLADYARSSLLMRPPPVTQPQTSHLAGASHDFLGRLHSAYLHAVARRHPVEEAPFAAWEAVNVAARLSEPVPSGDLVNQWRRWSARGNIGTSGAAERPAPHH